MVNVNNSFVATPPIDGGVYHSAALGTPMPDTALEVLHEDFLANDHGAVGDNGIGINKNRSTQKIRQFGGSTFREPQTEFDESVTITLLEDDNPAVLVDVFGEANVEIDEVTEGGVHKRIYHTSEQLPIKSHIVTAIDGAKTKRYLIEKGQITQTAEVTDVHSDVTKHQITITTYQSSKGRRGEHVLELRHDGNPPFTDVVKTLEVITESPLPAATVDEPYTAPLESFGGSGTKTWTLAAGTLPAGLTITGASITGTPTAAGNRTFVVRVTDAEGEDDTKQLTIAVAA